MRRRFRLLLALTSLVVVATAAVPASAHHLDLAKAEVDFGSCREVVAAKTVRTDAVAEYLPDDVLPVITKDGSELVIRAAKCRWLKAAYGGHIGGTKQPIVIQVGISVDDNRLVKAPERPHEDELYSLFTVTNSPALARAARAAGHARVYMSDDVRFWMGHAETCGEPVRTVISVRDDKAPSFSLKGVVNAPGPKCDPIAVGSMAWTTVRGDVASTFVYKEHRQTVVRSETQLEMWAARNTRMNKIVGSAHFKSDSVRTGLIKANDVSPDAVIIPHRLGL